MKKLVYIMSIFALPLLFSCNATTTDVAALNKQRDELDSTISSRQKTSGNLTSDIYTLTERKSTLAEQVKLLEAQSTGKKITYIVGVEVSIRKGFEFTTTDADFEIPVSKEFYESAQEGKDVGDVSVSRAFHLSMHSARCKITKKRTIISN